MSFVYVHRPSCTAKTTWARRAEVKSYCLVLVPKMRSLSCADMHSMCVGTNTPAAACTHSRLSKRFAQHVALPPTVDRSASVSGIFLFCIVLRIPNLVHLHVAFEPGTCKVPNGLA